MQSFIAVAKSKAEWGGGGVAGVLLLPFISFDAAKQGDFDFFEFVEAKLRG